jgi:arginyl-tRNA synthetase
MQGEILEIINKALEKAFPESKEADFSVEHPAELSHGEYSTNVALVLSKQIGDNPRAVAEKLVTAINSEIENGTNNDANTESTNKEGANKEIERVEIAGPGFINFYLSTKFFRRSIQQIMNGESNYGRNKRLDGKNIIIEFTDPNPMKQFHIGHLMSNAIGESLSRIIEWNGATVTRVCYQGDVGMHVAKTLWGMMKKISENPDDMPNEDSSVTEKTKFLGDSYVLGATKYKEAASEEASDETKMIKTEIEALNKKVYDLYDETKENDDAQIADLYEKGRAWSLQHFDELYGLLGTNFSQLIFENQMAKRGLEIVRSNTPGIFEESDGAIVYKGEQDGFHTRVFINSIGLPTYEAKDIALAHFKENELSEKFGKFDKSVIITADEQKQYMQVVLAALSKINPEIADKTFHMTHGMMRFADGKMSSRTGNVIAGDELIENISEMVSEKLNEADKDLSESEKSKVKDIVAVGAIKYSILKQAPGKNIVFETENSISFEGDSGPYLQYTYTRAKSIIDKAIEQGIFFADAEEPENWQRTDLEKFLYRFPEVVSQAYSELAPHHIVTLLTKIAGEFNSFYAQNQILDGGPDEDYKLAITKSTMTVLQNGLKVLGIKVPGRM